MEKEIHKKIKMCGGGIGLGRGIREIIGSQKSRKSNYEERNSSRNV